MNKGGINNTIEINRKSIFSGLGWLMFETIGSKGINTLVFLLLARLLSPDAFGLVALGSVFIFFFSIIADLGFSVVIIQKEDIEEEHLNAAFWSNLLIVILLSGIIFLVAPFIAKFYGEAILTQLIRLLLIGLIIQSASRIQEALLHKHLQFRALAKRRVIALSISGFVGIIGALSGAGLWSLAIQSLSFIGIEAIWIWYLSPFRPSWQFSIKAFKDLISLGYKIILKQFLHKLSMEELIIGAMLNVIAVGYYSIAKKIFKVFTEVLNSTISKLSFPVFSKLKEDKAKNKKLLQDFVRYSSYYLLPAFLGLVFIIPSFVSLLIGDEWKDALPILQCFLLSGPFLIHYTLFDNYVLSQGAYNQSLFSKAINTAIILSGVALLMYLEYPLYSIGYVLALSNLASILYLFSFAQALLPLSFSQYLRSLFPGIVCSLLILGLQYKSDILFQEILLPSLQQFLQLGLELMIYGGAIFLLIRIKNPEILLGLIRKLKGFIKV